MAGSGWVAASGTLVLALSLGCPVAMNAQAVPTTGPRTLQWPAGAAQPSELDGGDELPWRAPPRADSAGDASLGRLVVSSLIVPGAGQWLQGQRRWIGYVAVEAASILFTLERRRAGSFFRDSYRDLAWSAARAGTAIGRVDLDFAYYERVANFGASGSFDNDASTPGIQPETNAATYNGQVWELARGLFLRGASNPTASDPGYPQALEYYVERSYDDRFLWDWQDRATDLNEYRRLIRRSDDAFRTATVLLGVSVANHIVSAVDAFVSSRGASLGLENRLRFEGAPLFQGLGSGPMSWQLQIRVTP